MSFYSALLGKIFSRGVERELTAGLNFVAPLQAVPNEATGLTDVSGADVPMSYTVATLPPAALGSGRVVMVSDGHDGEPCIAWSDGASWWVMATKLGKPLAAAATYTIAAGVITITGSSDVRVDTEGLAASDDLTTINGTVPGQTLVLRANHSSRTVVVKDGLGNFFMNGDFSLDRTDDRIVFRSDGASLYEISRSDNGI